MGTVLVLGQQRVNISNTWWLGPLIVLQLVDSVVSLAAGLAVEANPLMAWTWARYGFWVPVMFKLIGVLGHLLTCQLCCSPRNRNREVHVPAFHFVTVLVLVALFGVCVWNVYWFMV